MKLGKTLLWIVAAVLVLGGGYYIINKNKEKQQKEVEIVASKLDEIAVNTAKLEYKDLSADFMVNGNFEPIQQMTFPSEMSGRIINVMVKEGDYVRVGQTLATIKKDAIEVDMTQAQNNLQNAIADNQRFENAFKTGGVTKQQVDNSRLQLKNARAAVEAQGLRVRDTNVKATISGVINTRFIEPGSVVAPGTQMFEIVNVSRLKLKVAVNESEIVNLRVGQNIKVLASVLPDDEFVGKLTFIAPKADASLNFPVEIEVSNNNKLKAGMYGTAVFSTAGDAAATKAIAVIPATAFVNGVSSNTVFVVENGIAKITKIVSGRVIGEYVEVLSGLKEGAEVVTSGQINLSDGEKVRIVK
ncbi:efflux RND transporter periplasmic adaptor subunit [Faecalibacter rhinopitheci]|uniref:Efflux RND transporter periplasmic adaptor subunit n=1 Tax=Faecalibacter rhinopitheci TaxID=2779678 RepID=A0A8J7KEB8_9FLAO|nr:efflux RND transporter periplasmic adaptor subunit [Faecalibacter rhinopitheci]MBF0598261.1 efflux RND transporter periplasmic adaptor subunit [Faecalibacter rhinopitheci]MBQ0148024.1 efflux RND transporter periplasmic adaptor subunit [Candidatus Onthonaster equi]